MNTKNISIKDIDYKELAKECKTQEDLTNLTKESMAHMKYYAILMSSLGILGMPTIVEKEEYMISDLTKFLDKNIREEIEEVRDMEQIVLKIKVDEFKNLLQFIQKQEEHHILILQKTRRSL